MEQEVHQVSRLGANDSTSSESSQVTYTSSAITYTSSAITYTSSAITYTSISATAGLGWSAIFSVAAAAAR